MSMASVCHGGACFGHGGRGGDVLCCCSQLPQAPAALEPGTDGQILPVPLAALLPPLVCRVLRLGCRQQELRELPGPPVLGPDGGGEQAPVLGSCSPGGHCAPTPVPG